jgi:hypothetical protein
MSSVIRAPQGLARNDGDGASTSFLFSSLVLTAVRPAVGWHCGCTSWAAQRRLWLPFCRGLLRRVSSPCRLTHGALGPNPGTFRSIDDPGVQPLQTERGRSWDTPHWRRFRFWTGPWSGSPCSAEDSSRIPRQPCGLSLPYLVDGLSAQKEHLANRPNRVRAAPRSSTPEWRRCLRLRRMP